MNLSFRPITDDDAGFLYDVYASTREDELSIVPWSDEEKKQFLQMQFDAQHGYYQQHFPDAAFDVILLDEVPIGRLYVHRMADEHRIVDIALLPQYRGKGLGSTIMTDLLQEAQSVGKMVGIHVERNNPALQLYERLGFERIEDQGVYYLMKWQPPGIVLRPD